MVYYYGDLCNVLIEEVGCMIEEDGVSGLFFCGFVWWFGVFYVVFGYYFVDCEVFLCEIVVDGFVVFFEGLEKVFDSKEDFSVVVGMIYVDVVLVVF